LAEFKKEFEDNAPPDMINDETELSDIKTRLGDLAGDKSDGDIGPAPDGFVASETVASAPAAPPRPAVKRPAPAPAGMVKRPAPAAPAGPRPAPTA